MPDVAPNKIIIADNAAFHKSLKARELIEAKQYELLFLPAYSPDLNPIEHEWFPIKNKIRQLLEQGNSLAFAVEKTLKEKSELIC